MPADDDPKRIVAAGYDAMAGEYGRWASGIEDDPRDRMIEAFSAGLRAGSRVLDLGCGSGVPSTKALAERFDVVGVDFSTSQIELARSNVPSATFIVGDMTQVDFPDASFEGVTAFYTLNHVPRDDHGPLFGRVARWLAPGGRFLAALGVGDEASWTGEWLGVPMYFSSHDLPTTRTLVEAAGLEVILHEVVEIREPEGRVSFQWVLARKPGTVRGHEDRTGPPTGAQRR